MKFIPTSIRAHYQQDQIERAVPNLQGKHIPIGDCKRIEQKGNVYLLLKR